MTQYIENSVKQAEIKVEATIENSPEKYKENSFQCGSCNQWFDSEKVLYMHFRIAHNWAK